MLTAETKNAIHALVIKCKLLTALHKILWWNATRCIMTSLITINHQHCKDVLIL